MVDFQTESSSPASSQRRLRLGSALLASCVLLVSACATEPFSRIDGDRSWPTIEDSYNVVVIGVDDRWYMPGFNTLNVEPGTRAITFATTFPGSDLLEDRLTVEVDLKACTLYDFYALHESPLNPRDWTVRLARTTKLGDCSDDQPNINGSQEI